MRGPPWRSALPRVAPVMFVDFFLLSKENVELTEARPRTDRAAPCSADDCPCAASS